MVRSLRLRLGAVLLAGALASPVEAQPAVAGLETAAGRWDLSLDGANRSCRVMLAVEESTVGRALRFPAGCRRALPILNGLGGWTAPDNHRVVLLDAQGAAALRFERDGDDGLVARMESGEVFRLERPEGVVQPVRLPPAPAIGVPQMTPVDPAKAPPLASLPGVYLVDRYSEREVCRIDLGRAMLSASGRFEARVLEGCRDLGISAFDPVSWRYEAGRLTLTARRGHEVTLVSERDGHWRRDPEVGATLILRKAQAP
jgi:hypothetical protein